MVDKITKFLLKLNKTEYQKVVKILAAVAELQIAMPKLRKLAGYKNLYRLRFGKYRLIYKLVDKELVLQKLAIRNDKTYKDL